MMLDVLDATPRDQCAALLQASSERQEVVDFLQKGRELLALQASSVEDIARAAAQASSLVEALPAMVQVGS
jgi:hypothetical protein